MDDGLKDAELISLMDQIERKQETTPAKQTQTQERKHYTSPSSRAAMEAFNSCDDAWMKLAEQATMPASSNATVVFNSPEKEWVRLSEQIESNISCPVGSAEGLSATTNANSGSGSSSIDLTSQLKKFYGYQEFRPQQKEVVEAIMMGHDVAVYWSTGSGKSLCYQLPALVTNKISIIISPMVSLMEDQVRTFNMTVGQGKEEAVLLGTGQTDPHKERRAFEGHYKLIYLTPEKLDFVKGDLARLHTRRTIGMLAVDEAHCASQWGNDFRPDYASIGKRFRKIGALSNIPIMALTATSTQIIRNDILEKLCMNVLNVKAFNKSVDRPNLKLAVKTMTATLNNFSENLKGFLNAWSNNPMERGSTIIYAATTNTVDQLVYYLGQKLAEIDATCLVAGYHAKMSLADRRSSHESFLTGKCKVIVATVAFGMGIDKADIRRVVLYGPPKDMELYYQQIGRAGRDGRASECILLYSEADMNKFGNEFYLEGKSEHGKQLALESLKKVRLFANNSNECRRCLIMRHFEEIPTFTTCDNCDNCMNKGNSDLEVDYTVLSHVIFSKTPMAPRNITQSKLIEDVLNYIKKESTNEALNDFKLKRSKTFMNQFLKEIVLKLLGKGYLEIDTRRSTNASGYNLTYSVISLTNKGDAKKRQNTPIMLRVPEILSADIERKNAERLAKQEELAAEGIVVKDSYGDEEGTDQVTHEAYKWMKAVKLLRTSTVEALQIKAKNKEEFLRRIFEWRDAAAQTLRLAPENLMQEAIAYKIAYNNASSVEGLSTLGLRIAGETLHALSEKLDLWLVELDLKESNIQDNSKESTRSSSGFNNSDEIIFEHGSQFPLVKSKEYNIGKKAPSWLESYERFNTEGKSIESIALERNILSSTVIGHILDAFEHGFAVDFTRLLAENKNLGNLGKPLPTFTICKKFEQVQTTLGLSIEQLHKEYHSKKSVLANIDIDGLAEILDAKFNDMTPVQSTLKSKWYSYIHWWVLLRVTGWYDKLLQRSIERAVGQAHENNTTGRSYASPGAGMSWCFEDDKFLWENRIRPAKDLSEHFNRDVGSIQSRLTHLQDPTHSAHKRLASTWDQNVGIDVNDTRNRILGSDSPSSKQLRTDPLL